MREDPRLKEALKAFRHKIRSQTPMDENINENFAPFPKKEPEDIKYVQINSDRSDEERLIQSKEQGGQFCAKGSGRRVKDGLLEQILSEWHSQQISNGIKVSGTMLRRKAQEIS